MSTLDAFIEKGEAQTASDRQGVVLAIRKLATNKDLRVFLTALCKYSKADWAAMVRACKLLYSVMQSSLLIKNDSALADELVRTPHIAMFVKRLTEDES